MRQGRRLEKSALARRDAVRVAMGAGEPVIRLLALLYTFAPTCPDISTAAGKTPGCPRCVE